MAEPNGFNMADCMEWGDGGVVASLYLITNDDVRGLAEGLRSELGDYFVDGLTEHDVSSICEKVGYGTADEFTAFIAQLGAKMRQATHDELVRLKEARDGGYA